MTATGVAVNLAGFLSGQDAVTWTGYVLYIAGLAVLVWIALRVSVLRTAALPRLVRHQPSARMRLEVLAPGRRGIVRGALGRKGVRDPQLLRTP